MHNDLFKMIEPMLCKHGKVLHKILETMETIRSKVRADRTAMVLMEFAVNQHEMLHEQERVLASIMKIVIKEKMNIASGECSDETILFYAQKMEECETRVLAEYQQLFDDLTDGVTKRLEVLK